MNRIDLGDLSRWLIAQAHDKLITHFVRAPSPEVAYSDKPEPTRLDVVVSAPTVVSILCDDDIFPCGVILATSGITTITFSSVGPCKIVFETSPDEYVAIRRYGDRSIASPSGDSFTSYDPSNFVDSDMDRIQRLMNHNQLVMMQRLQTSYDNRLAEIEKLQKLSGKEKKDGQSNSPGETEGNEKAGGTPSPVSGKKSGDAPADEVKSDD